MKEGIHPTYGEAVVTCACGNQFKTRSTKSLIKLVICSQCHPFYTGSQRFVQMKGRVEQFQKRFEKTGGKMVKRAPVKAKATKAKAKSKILSSAPVKAPKTTAAPAPKKEKGQATPHK